MKCLSRSSMGGILDTLLNPQASADAWIADQRAAVSGDMNAQRVALVRDLRVVASEATTEAAIKLAIAGVVAFGVSLVVYKLASRSR